MQLYFIKATYTNNVYKLSDFYLMDEYKLIANKMLDINFRPDDGLSSFITSKIILLDGSKIWEHTHIIIPEYDKIYRIASIDYVNNEQYNVTLDEDALIGNYQELKSENIILTRSNDSSLFRGVNDIADMSLKETVETKVIPSTYKTGKWMLIFMQVNSDKTRYGLEFDSIGPVVGYRSYERYDDIAALVLKYPEVTTTTPNLYDYYQKIVRVGTGISDLFQCVYDGNGSNSKLIWIENPPGGRPEGKIYFDLGVSTATKINSSDVRNVIVALPFEVDFRSLATDNSTIQLMHAEDFVGVVDSGEIIDIKIIDDIMLPINGVTYDFWHGTDPRQLLKTISSDRGIAQRIYTAASGGDPISFFGLYIFYDFEKEINLNPSYFTTTPIITDAEPFKKYDLYIHGKKFPIPYYLTNNIKLLIIFNSGVINYLIYYNDKRNIVASGSFTHSMKYQVDKLDQFYNQNPTYKDQFFTKMAVDSIKGVMGGAVAGSVVPGLGTAAGAGLGLISAGVDAGISMLNLHYQEKGLRLMPDQIFGENSELGLQLINIFGIYWVKRTPENADYMKIEYDLRGFPVSTITKIQDLNSGTSMFGTSVIVYGEIKKVIKNEFVTGFINNKLKEGVIIL